MVQIPYLNQCSPMKASPETLTSCHFSLFQFNRLSFPHHLAEEGINHWEMQTQADQEKRKNVRDYHFWNTQELRFMGINE